MRSYDVFNLFSLRVTRGKVTGARMDFGNCDRQWLLLAEAAGC